MCHVHAILLLGPLIENIPKVRQNTPFYPRPEENIDESRGCQSRTRSHTQWRFCPGGRRSGAESAQLVLLVQLAGIDPPTIVAAVKHARPVRSMIENSETFVLSTMGQDNNDGIEY